MFVRCISMFAERQPDYRMRDLVWDTKDLRIKKNLNGSFCF